MLEERRVHLALVEGDRAGGPLLGPAAEALGGGRVRLVVAQRAARPDRGDQGNMPRLGERARQPEGPHGTMAAPTWLISKLHQWEV
jgi:hypothetical protein